MANRRSFLTRGAAAAASTAIAARFRGDALVRLQEASLAVGDRAPEEVARDEDYWSQIQRAFSVDRGWIYLNNGGVSPSPRMVEDAVRRNLEFSNKAPSHALWRILDPRREFVRDGLASLFGCDREEVAICRNASEAMETLIFGLDLKPGDEVLASDQNYPRMISAWRQRQRREGIVFKTFSAPPMATSEALVDLYRKRITPRTRVLEVCHVVNITGQIWPVKEIVALGRERGIKTFVDGAHGFAHFPFTRDELGCDFYGTSLHKWLLAPIGTGMLYVRKELIEEIWPLMAAEEKLRKNIRKFEQIGTHPAALHNAIAEALTFHQGIGGARKAARLRYLNRRWIRRLESHPKIRLLTDDDPSRSCGIRLLSVEGPTPASLAHELLKRFGIIVSSVQHGRQFGGIRVTPNVFTLPAEIDRFAGAVEKIIA